MTKPDFFSLPGDIIENMLWDMDLKYDPYESSKSEVIHEILCDYSGGHRNKDIIARYYASISTEKLAELLKIHLDALEAKKLHCLHLLSN